MSLLRPSFQTLSRSLRKSVLVAPPSTTSSVSSQTLRSSHPSRISHQLRGLRTSPFSRPGQFTAPHASLPLNAPTSISQPGGWSRALTSLGVVGGTAFAVNLFLNRETRDSLHPVEADYLHKTFQYLGGGLALTATAAVGLHKYGISQRVMAANPWLVLGVGLVASIGGMIGAQSLPPGHPMKVPCWLLFNASQAAVLSPLLFLNPAVLSRAGLYTAGLVGSLCWVGATAKEDKFLWLGGPLLAGVTIVALSSLAPMVLPRTAFRTLAVTESLSLYGGLAVFGAFVLYDTQRVLKHAQAVRFGYTQGDPLAESIGLELDFINIFIRIVQILMMQQNRRK